MRHATCLAFAVAALGWASTGCSSVEVPTRDAGQPEPSVTCVDAWAAGFPTEGSSEGMSIAAAGEGEVVVAGNLDGQLDLGAGPLVSAGGAPNLFVAKLDCAGRAKWSKAYPIIPAPPGFGPTVPTGLAVGADGTIIVTGEHSGGLDLGTGPFDGLGGFVLALDPSGATRWVRHFEAKQAPTRPDSVAIDDTGDVFISGVAAGPADLGKGPLGEAGSFYAFVAKLDATGTTKWVETVGRGSLSWFHVRVVGPGQIVACGTAPEGIDFSNGPLPAEQALACAKLAADDGAPLWVRGFPATNAAIADMKSTSQGEVALVGAAATADLGSVQVSASGSSPLPFLLKLDASGAPTIAATFDTQASLVTLDVAAQPDAGLVAAITFSDGTLTHAGQTITAGSGSRVALAFLDASGAPLGAEALGERSVGRSLEVDGSGALLLAGRYRDAPAVFGKALPAATKTAPFFARHAR